MSASTSYVISWLQRYFLYSLRVKSLGFITHSLDPNQFRILIMSIFASHEYPATPLLNLYPLNTFTIIITWKLLWIRLRTPRRYPRLLSSFLPKRSIVSSINGSSTTKGISTHSHTINIHFCLRSYTHYVPRTFFFLLLISLLAHTNHKIYL